jgi:hypothetical protein
MQVALITPRRTTHPTLDMTLRLTCMLATLVLSTTGCATFEPVPKDYTGPTATLKDSGFAEDGGKAQLFAAMQIDGNRIGNAFGASAAASHGRGNNLTPVFPERKLKAMPAKLSLRCSHATGAPIAALASQMAGTFFSVEGVVDFTPAPGGSYVVKGELKKEKSTCWIEDEATGKPATATLGQ